jgi:hypothetical protein
MIEKGHWLMDTITSRHITDLTGARARMLHDLCKDLGVGKTQQGAERQFDPLDASLVTLAARLTNQGIRRSEAIAIALQTKDDLARLIRNPADQRCWLFASRLDGERWKTLVVEGIGSPAMLTDPGAPGYAVTNLRAVVRDVIAAGVAAA